MWQPIETAPKDETRVLLARRGVAAMHTAAAQKKQRRAMDDAYAIAAE